MADQITTESFEIGDLKLVLEPRIGIDFYCSKIGKDADIVVIDFTLHDKTAASDLVDFIEKGYDFCLDSDISASEVSPGSYLVFVEILRRSRLISQIFKIISDLTASSGLSIKEWKFRYVTDEKYYPVTKESLKAHVPLSPAAYKKIVTEPIKEMKQLSGIAIQEDSPKDLAIQAIQHAAGIS